MRHRSATRLAEYDEDPPMAAPEHGGERLSIARPSEPPTLDSTTRIAVITDQ
jgi:hypothetical protein